jgi:hypothetical protein
MRVGYGRGENRTPHPELWARTIFRMRCTENQLARGLAYLLVIFAHFARLVRNGIAPWGELTVSRVVENGCMCP